MSPTDDDPLLAEIKHRIVEALHPERVILFGSRARGEAREGSDVDLLVVADTEDSPWRYGARVRKALRGLPLTKDVVVFSPEEFAARSKWLSGVARRASEEGVVLYEVDEAAGQGAAGRTQRQPVEASRYAGAKRQRSAVRRTSGEW